MLIVPAVGGGHLFRFAFCLTAGDAQDGVAGPHQFPVAPAIALESHGGAMEVAAVGLEGEAVVGPEEVDLDAAVGEMDWRVEERRREVSPDEEWQHLCLQGAFELPALPEEGRRSAPFLDQLQQHLHPPASRIDRALDRREVEHVPSCRPLESAAQRPFADYACEIHERPRRTGAGNAVHGSGLLESRRSHAMQVDAVDPAASGRRSDHIDHHRPLIDELQ